MPLNFKFVSSGQAVEDAASVAQTLRGNSLKPLAPVNLRGSRNANLDLLAEWNRRARIAAGLRPGSDVPLGEEQELYDVEIYSGSTIKRTARIRVNEPELPLWRVFFNDGSQTVTITSKADVDIVGLTLAKKIVVLSDQIFQPEEFLMSFICDTRSSPTSAMPLKVGIVPVSQDPVAYGTNITYGFRREFVGDVPQPIGFSAPAAQLASTRLVMSIRGGLVRYYQDPGELTASPVLGVTASTLNEPFRVAIYHQVQASDTGDLIVQLPIVRRNSPSFFYTAADQVADFGSTQSAIKTRVYQVSSIVGRGAYIEKTI